MLEFTKLLQGMPASLAHEAFGIFLDNAAAVSLDKNTCQTVLELIVEMSESYMNTGGMSALKVSRQYFGPDYDGEVRGSETERAQRFRHRLHELVKVLLPNLSVTTLEPSAVSLVGPKILV